MNTVVAPVSLLNTSKLFGQGAGSDKRERHRNRKATHQRSDAAPPRKLSGDSAARRYCRLSKTYTQGLIHIVAELGFPIEYPAPEFRVITTLYAWREDDPLALGNVWTWITPKPDCAMKAGDAIAT